MQPRIGLRGRRNNRQRQNARPDRKRVIFFVVFRGARANLRGDFGQRQSEYRRGLQFEVGRPADLIPAPGDNVLGERVQCIQFFIAVFHGHRAAQNYNRAVIHGMMKRRARQHNAVYMRHRDANLHAA